MLVAKIPKSSKRGGAWRKVCDVPRGARWDCDKFNLSVVSTLDVTTDGPEFHVSVARRAEVGTGAAPRRATIEELERVKAAFKMQGAHEDNHGPHRFTRSLWLHTDPAMRKDCDCFEEEPEVLPIPAGGEYLWREDSEAIAARAQEQRELRALDTMRQLVGGGARG